MLARLGDFFGDHRFPWNRPSPVRLSKRKTEMGKPLVALTFDVEQDEGSRGAGKIAKVVEFLEQIEKVLGKRKATFFIQGDLAEKFSGNLKLLSKKYELGVHAWSHDRLWGDPVWFLDEKPLKKSEKETYLCQALESFSKTGLGRPRSFRATNLVINEETLRLLGDFGFTVDSSWESFRDFRQPFRLNGLWEIPVSSLPQPRRRLGIFRDYQVFNMANMERLPAKIWQENLEQIISVQQAPHVVFMAHSWDFNRQKFNWLLTLLEQNYQVEYVAMQELARTLEDRGEKQ